MDNNNEGERENGERRNSNTEYIPTKCRITKPPPPKPATNPLQFIKVAPCPLFQKAHEQIKKVEEIKKERKEVREEAEDWQQNLDNWKSSRRKRQEHIIERVVEVKKLEQEEQERHRRKSKTFSEMIEDRSRGRHKFNIHIYNDDDSNDLSDYGIGSSSSKTNSIKDVDTDDSCSILDEKEHRSLDSPCNKDNSSASNQSQSEDESNIKKDTDNINIIQSHSFTSNLYVNKTNATTVPPSKLQTKLYDKTDSQTNEHYTYEGAIQDYRSRIRSKIHIDESIFTKNPDFIRSKEVSEAQVAIPKGELCKRKELFEIDKPVKITNYESIVSRRLSEDFVNTQSIKQRLQSLEKCADIAMKSNDKNDVQSMLVKQRLQNFAKDNDVDNKNNNSTNNNHHNNNNINKPQPNKISNYLLQKSNSSSSFETKNNKANLEWKKKEIPDRCSSPETELYMDKLTMFSKDLDNLFSKTNHSIDDYCVHSNYPPSTSSTELMASSDREDSGIHTADVSCSVSQADEPVEDNDLITTIPNYIEKLSINEQNQNFNTEDYNKNFTNQTDDKQFISITTLQVDDKRPNECSLKNIVSITCEFLDNLKSDSSENLIVPSLRRPIIIKDNNNLDEEPPQTTTTTTTTTTTKIYENIVYNKPIVMSTNEIVVDESFTLAPATMKEPPKKPPPPPPVDEISSNIGIKRLNSAKRLKREIHIKRSSFLGLDEPTDDQLYPELNVDKPPDINMFLQKESKMEKTLYKKVQDENRMGILSKVESHDSGLDIDRGRLSSDTWCSSIGDSSTPSPERQDSEQTNSITSEEDEITKKEREIIEMVEKEEKSRDILEYSPISTSSNNDDDKLLTVNHRTNDDGEPFLGGDNFNSPYFPKTTTPTTVTTDNNYLDDQDSEVLKVEQELRQLEKEELERQRDNLLFQESRAKARMQNNRHSLENIFDEIYPTYPDVVNYRKSMPELQHVPLEYRKSLSDVPNAYNIYNKPVPELDVQYRKSMPDIQHAYNKMIPDYHRETIPNDTAKTDHRKSMPELQNDLQKSAFKSPLPVKRQPIMPGKPLRPFTKDQKERILLMNNGGVPSDGLQMKQSRQLSRHSLQALSAVPKSRHLPVDNWIQPRANPEVKSYNQHWLFQEAELRRITEQQKNAAANRNWQQLRHEKHLPDAVIQTLTQRVQNRTDVNERNQPIRRPDSSPNKDCMQQHPYLGHNQTVGHALPRPYPPPMVIEESQDKILSVSGKKKCSYCSNELGRGAAMIIESLCLFYHMECFKCCVCHMQLGDGLMGTDVRVRNQKLHCHNCYSSDDGVKFSCV